MKLKTVTYQIQWVLYHSQFQPPAHTVPEVKMTLQDKLFAVGTLLAVGYFVVRGFIVK